MRKNFGEIFETVEVDPVTGQYFIKLPEQIINDLSWYEDTEISFKLEGTELVLSERHED